MCRGLFPAGLWCWLLALPRLICGFGSSEGEGAGGHGDCPLASRQWVHATRSAGGTGEELKVASYNMLADCYVFEDDYPHTPQAALDWGCGKTRTRNPKPCAPSTLKKLNQKPKTSENRKPPWRQPPGWQKPKTSEKRK